MENWKTVRLGDVCEKGSSNIAQNEITDNNGEYPIYGAAGFIKNVDFYKQDKPYIGIVKDGAGVGRVSVHPAKSSLIGTMQYIFPKENIDIKFLAEFLKYQNLSRFYTGATIPHIYFKDYQNIPLKLPSLQKQKHISAVLDKCTALIAKHKLMLEKYDTLIKSRFIEMFGDPVQNPMDWDIKKLSDYMIFLTSGSRGWSEYFSNEGKLFLTIKNVKNNRINIENIQYVQAPKNKEAERTKVQENDLLISITADLGRTGVVSKEIANYGAYINQHLSLVRLNTEKVNPLFVSYYLETDGGKLQFNKKNQSAVKAGLNFEAIKSLTFMNPPLKKQNEFVAFVQQIDKSKFAVQKSLEKAETLYKSLMQEYFG